MTGSETPLHSPTYKYPQYLEYLLLFVLKTRAYKYFINELSEF